jgi:hypothetical protein
MANKIKGEACNQRQRGYFFRLQDGYVFRLDNANLAYNVTVNVPRPNELNHIALNNALQPAKKSIPVPCDPQVSGFAYPCGSKNSSHAAIQSQVVCIIEDGNLQVDLAYTENGNRKISFLGETVLVCSDPLGRP